MNERELNRTKFLITRPKLATILIDQGFECKITTNPYNQDLKAWTISLDSSSAEIIGSFYESIGKDIPSSVQKIREGGMING